MLSESFVMIPEKLQHELFSSAKRWRASIIAFDVAGRNIKLVFFMKD
jgi:hypothetical protein